MPSPESDFAKATPDKRGEGIVKIIREVYGFFWAEDGLSRVAER